MDPYRIVLRLEMPGHVAKEPELLLADVALIQSQLQVDGIRVTLQTWNEAKRFILSKLNRSEPKNIN